MLDPKLMRNEPEAIKKALKNRGNDPALVDSFLSADEEWRRKVFESEQMKNKQNEISSQVAGMKKRGEDVSKLFEEMKALSQRQKVLTEEAGILEKKAKDILLVIPNIPSETTPAGKGEKENKEIRKWGEKKNLSFEVKPHDEIGDRLGIFNFKQAAKISGSRFVVYHGLGAKLEMALINFMLDVQTKENGYKQVMTPFMVNSESMLGTGQLPKFGEELYKTSDDLYMIPTAEVPVTNIHRDDVFSAEALPLKYVSYSPCFRREAGSYGKDVKGIIRQHQFNKVELVKFCRPEDSYNELESLTADAEKVLQLLELPYRVIVLSTGDLGFSAAKTYDIEVWFPSENRYREISSCSNFTDFQARRANIKFKTNPKSKLQFVHTLNGSGLAVGRTMAAILENFQQEDGSVLIPEILHPYMQVSSIQKR
ncbi:MAG: serine--tRNA ligase [Candidatus Saganbacteria bacterium]|nr:serine--tRNA ligase [Candidatus Saganbacteria bacterium]